MDRLRLESVHSAQVHFELLLGALFLLRVTPVEAELGINARNRGFLGGLVASPRALAQDYHFLLLEGLRQTVNHVRAALRHTEVKLSVVPCLDRLGKLSHVVAFRKLGQLLAGARPQRVGDLIHLESLRQVMPQLADLALLSRRYIVLINSGGVRRRDIGGSGVAANVLEFVTVVIFRGVDDEVLRQAVVADLRSQHAAAILLLLALISIPELELLHWVQVASRRADPALGLIVRLER